jgi:hypothetical protein
MTEPYFLTLDDILFIQQQGIQISGGEPNKELKLQSRRIKYGT